MDKPFPEFVGKRIFIFPAPIEAVLLNDEQVSWYFQKRMIDLTADEAEQELAYRREQKMEFPLGTIPD